MNNTNHAIAVHSKLIFTFYLYSVQNSGLFFFKLWSKYAALSTKENGLQSDKIWCASESWTVIRRLPFSRFLQYPVAYYPDIARKMNVDKHTHIFRSSQKFLQVTILNFWIKQAYFKYSSGNFVNYQADFFLTAEMSAVQSKTFSMLPVADKCQQFYFFPKGTHINLYIAVLIWNKAFPSLTSLHLL